MIQIAMVRFVCSMVKRKNGIANDLVLAKLLR